MAMTKTKANKTAGNPPKMEETNEETDDLLVTVRAKVSFLYVFVPLLVISSVSHKKIVFC